MKKVQLKKLKDNSKFRFNKRSKVYWTIQSKFKVEKRWFVTITANESGITKNKNQETEVWID